MAGHSQFKNIMHRKGAQDARRARAFAKIIREITVSVRGGSADPNANPRLRAALVAARQANMTRDTVERAIRKASGEGGGDDYVARRYEGYGPGGVAVIVEALTDNLNRTASDLRTLFSRHGGALGEQNAVAFMFQRLGVIRYQAAAADAEAMLEAAIEAGAENVESGPAGHEVTCGAEELFAVQQALAARFGEPEEAKREWRPTTTASVEEEQAASVLKLIDALEDLDDVQAVFANFEVSDAVLAKLSA